MSFSSYQKRWTDSEFKDYAASVDLGWADSVTIHHTAFPDLAMRPNGLTAKHMQYIMEYYRDEKRWSAGPHLFIDDIATMGMSPLTSKGVHARSFNSHSIGIEMLGNYDEEDPWNGRGKRVVKRTARAVAEILKNLGLEASPTSILFHRDDPKTSKTCPGTLLPKADFIKLVQNSLGRSNSAPTALPLSLDERVARIENHLNLT